MTEYTCIAGIATSDACFAYIGVQPFLPREVIVRLHDDLAQERVSTCATSLFEILPDSPELELITQLELRQGTEIAESKLSKIAHMLVGLVHDYDKFSQLDILSLVVPFDGPDPLFQQYQHAKSLDSIRSGQAS